MTKLVLIATLMAVMAAATAASAQQASITNIDIKMARNDSNGPFGIRAEITNPNDFSVKDVRVRCSFQDAGGKALKIYDSTIVVPFPPRQKIIIQRLDIGAWPEQAIKASCASSSAQRF